MQEEITEPTVETPEAEQPIIESVADAVDMQEAVNKALADAKEQMREQIIAEMEQAKAEEAKLSKLSAAERERVELENLRKQLEAEREQINAAKMLTEVTTELTQRQLPAEFAGYLAGKDAEASLANIKQFEAVWQKALQDAVTAKLSQPHQPKQGTATAPTMTKAQFLAMSYKEQVAYKANNPEQFARIFN